MIFFIKSFLQITLAATSLALYFTYEDIRYEQYRKKMIEEGKDPL